MKKYLIISVLTILTAVACNLSLKGPGVDTSTNNKNESFKYNLSYNGCSTGEQSFNSRSEMCTGLQNNKLNNYCALDLRRIHFENECPGQKFSAF